MALDLKNAPDAVKQPLCSASRLERAIGVIYRCAPGIASRQDMDCPPCMHHTQVLSQLVHRETARSVDYQIFGPSKPVSVSLISFWQLTLWLHSNSGCSRIVHRRQLAASVCEPSNSRCSAVCAVLLECRRRSVTKPALMTLQSTTTGMQLQERLAVHREAQPLLRGHAGAPVRRRRVLGGQQPCGAAGPGGGHPGRGGGAPRGTDK